MLVAGFEAALALVSGGNAAVPQPSASRCPAAERRQPAHWPWCLPSLEADAHDDPPRVSPRCLLLLQGTGRANAARKEGVMHIRAESEEERLNHTKQEVGKFSHARK